MGIDREWQKRVIGLTTFIFIFIIPTTISAAVIVDLCLNDGGFVSFDHFKSELYLNNQGASVQEAKIFGILEIFGAYYFWPTFTQEVNFLETDILEGEASIVFLEFNFPDIDDYVPFGPMYFWGAWFLNEIYYGYDFQEFWLDSEHKWTPTPRPTDTPVPTETPTPTPSATQSIPPTVTPTMTPVVTPGHVYVGNMIAISAGSFTQGSPSSEPYRSGIERQFTHILTRDLLVMETEVTRQMWADLKAAQSTLPFDPSFTDQSPTMNHPVQTVTWYEALLYANLLSLQNGYRQCYYTDAVFTLPITSGNYTTGPFYCDFDADGYRLPTEGEWEYFTRAGTTGAFSCRVLNYTVENGESCSPGTHPTLELYCTYCVNDLRQCAVAGSKLPNPLGLKDVHGNVWEWCWDKYSAYPTGTVTDYTGGTGYNYRIMRGGSWRGNATYCRSAKRFWLDPYVRYNNIGFRLVRTAEYDLRLVLPDRRLGMRGKSGATIIGSVDLGNRNLHSRTTAIQSQ